MSFFLAGMYATLCRIPASSLWGPWDVADDREKEVSGKDDFQKTYKSNIGNLERHGDT